MGWLVTRLKRPQIHIAEQIVYLFASGSPVLSGGKPKALMGDGGSDSRSGPAAAPAGLGASTLARLKLSAASDGRACADAVTLVNNVVMLLCRSQGCEFCFQQDVINQ